MYDSIISFYIETKSYLYGLRQREYDPQGSSEAWHSQRKEIKGPKASRRKEQVA